MHSTKVSVIAAAQLCHLLLLGRVVAQLIPSLNHQLTECRLQLSLRYLSVSILLYQLLPLQISAADDGLVDLSYLPDVISTTCHKIARNLPDAVLLALCQLQAIEAAPHTMHLT